MLNILFLQFQLRRYDNIITMIPELQLTGKLLINYMTNISQRIFFLIIGDLSHTHKTNGPYSFSDKGIEFDSLIEKWILTQEENILTNKAANIVNEALSCGFAGFVLLQSILDRIVLKSAILCREIPDYYGMIVAYYINKKIN